MGKLLVVLRKCIVAPLADINVRQVQMETMMKSWRLKWVCGQFSLSSFSMHRQALNSAWKFWIAMIAKLVPCVWTSPITLSLKKGGVVNVFEFMTLYIYNEIFVEGCYDIPLLNTQNPVIIDVGSNTGLFVLRMKQLYPDSIVYGYEPMPTNYRQLELNLKSSRLAGYQIIKKGIGGSSRSEKLYIHGKNLGGHSIYNSQTTGKECVEIELISIAEALKPLDGRRCDLLKLDCEGAEYEIMKSITHEIARQIKLIVFESTPSLYDVNELIDHLRMTGYTVRSEKGLYHAEYNGITV